MFYSVMVKKKRRNKITYKKYCIIFTLKLSRSISDESSKLLNVIKMTGLVKKLINFLICIVFKENC